MQIKPKFSLVAMEISSTIYVAAILLHELHGPITLKKRFEFPSLNRLQKALTGVYFVSDALSSSLSGRGPSSCLFVVY